MLVSLCVFIKSELCSLGELCTLRLKVKIFFIPFTFFWYNYFFCLLISPNECAGDFFLIQLQDLETQLTDLWNLMDTSEEEQSLFNHVTCNIWASVDEVIVPGALALDLIEQVHEL